MRLPGLPDGSQLGRVWARGKNDAFTIANRTTPGTPAVQEAFLFHWDGTNWTQALHVPGVQAAQVFGTGNSEVFVSTWSGSAGQLFRSEDNGLSWGEDPLPSPSPGSPLGKISGTPGNVHVMAWTSGYVGNLLRFDGTNWNTIFTSSYDNPPRGLTVLSPNEGYFVGCWGWGRWDGLNWQWHGRQFDFCDVTDCWGVRDAGGHLQLYTVGGHNFADGIYVWKFDEATQSFRGKYSTVFGDGGTAGLGYVADIWGSAADDIYVLGELASAPDGVRTGRLYHSDGTNWSRVTEIGTVGNMGGLAGTARDDVWASFSDRLLHRGPALTNIVVSPVYPMISTLQGQSFTALGEFSDGVPRGLSGAYGLAWSCGASNVAVIDANGRATPTGQGYATISASVGGVVGTTFLFVTNLPPSIIKQPQGQTVAKGVDVTLEAVAQGSQPLSCQWQSNGTNLLGATNLTLTLTNVTTGQAGDYVLRVTNAFGVCISEVASLMVGLPPVMVTPPQGQTKVAGQSVTLTVAAEGTAPYAWEARSGLLPDQVEGGMQLVAAASPETPVLTGGSLVLATDDPEEGLYYSQEGTNLVMPTQLVIDAELRVGASATAEGVPLWASGAMVGFFTTPDLVNNLVIKTNYLRLWLDSSGDSGPGASISAAEGFHRCRIEVDTPTQPGATVRVYWDDALALTGVMGNYSVAQPAVWFGDGSSGASATSYWRSFRHNAAPLTYQWRKNGVALPGATGTSLTIGSLQPLDAGDYDVVVSGFGSVTSSVAALTVTSLPVPAPAGLVGWWPGDGNGNDRVGTNHGTVQNGATFAPGMAGQAFSFSAINPTVGYDNSVVVIPDSPTLHFGTGDLSVEAWIKCPPMWPGANGPRFLGKCGHSGGYPAISFCLDDVSGTLQFAVTDYTTGQWNPGDRFAVISPQRLDDDQWHHVAGVRISTGYRLFVDGLLVAMRTEPARNADNSSPLLIGALWTDFPAGAGEYPYRGMVDELSIYNRALSSDEIASIHAANRAGKGKSPLLTAQLQSQTVAGGGTAGWCANVAGSEPMSYQWQFNGTNIAGATNDCLAIANASPANAGLYSLVVTNQFGTMTAQAGLSLVDLKMFAGLTITGPAGHYRLEAMENLGGTNTWTILGTNFVTAEQMPFYYFDTNSPSHTKRFYRAIWMP